MVPKPTGKRELTRRETVERHHQLRDVEEDFDVAKAAASSSEDRQALMEAMFRFRSQHRTEDVSRGKRAAAGGIVMHQIMWARWIEMAAEHHRAAWKAFRRVSDGQTHLLVEELRQSLVTVAAAASTIEALFEDVKYLIPERRPRSTTAKTIADCLEAVFGLSSTAARDIRAQLIELFDRRNESLHGYSEPMPPELHPAGLMTGAELTRFNGPESRKALELALQVLEYAATPPQPANRWVSRWARERSAYFRTVVAPIREGLE